MTYYSFIALVHVVLLIILTGMIWFILKVRLKKQIKTRWILLAGAISTPIVYQIAYWLLYWWFVPMTPTMDFDQTVWKENWEKRVGMVDDLVDSELLINKTSKEVFQYLGAPDLGDTTHYLYYDTGWQYINGHEKSTRLDIKLEGNRVVSAEKSTHIIY